jgi:hypothetical protein
MSADYAKIFRDRAKKILLRGRLLASVPSNHFLTS